MRKYQAEFPRLGPRRHGTHQRTHTCSVSRVCSRGPRRQERRVQTGASGPAWREMAGLLSFCRPPRRWRMTLLAGFNLLLCGLGSKRALLEKFATESLIGAHVSALCILREARGRGISLRLCQEVCNHQRNNTPDRVAAAAPHHAVVVINGYLRRITVKRILDTALQARSHAFALGTLLTAAFDSTSPSMPPHQTCRRKLSWEMMRRCAEVAMLFCSLLPTHAGPDGRLCAGGRCARSQRRWRRDGEHRRHAAAHQG